MADSEPSLTHRVAGSRQGRPTARPWPATARHQRRVRVVTVNPDRVPTNGDVHENLRQHQAVDSLDLDAIEYTNL
jgi:hypothetical protein